MIRKFICRTGKEKNGNENPITLKQQAKDSPLSIEDIDGRGERRRRK
jgi:hypothetical protein